MESSAVYKRRWRNNGSKCGIWLPIPAWSWCEETRWCVGRRVVDYFQCAFGWWMISRLSIDGMKAKSQAVGQQPGSSRAAKSRATESSREESRGAEADLSRYQRAWERHWPAAELIHNLSLRPVEKEKWTGYLAWNIDVSLGRSLAPRNFHVYSLARIDRLHMNSPIKEKISLLSINAVIGQRYTTCHVAFHLVHFTEHRPFKKQQLRFQNQLDANVISL